VALAKDFVDKEVQKGDTDNPVFTIALNGMAQFNETQWTHLIKLIFPPELIRLTSERIVFGFFGWLYSEHPYPTILIPTDQWKDNLKNNGDKVIRMMLDALPPCDASLLLTLEGGDPLANEALLGCRPPEPFCSSLVAASLASIPSMLEQIPDEQNVGSVFFGEAGVETEARLREAKATLLMIRTILLWGWSLLAVIFLFAIPMVARTGSGAFKTAGLPLLLAGGLSIVLLLILQIVGLTVSLSLTERMLVDSTVPQALILPVIEITRSIVANTVLPLGFQGVGLMVLGGLLLLLAKYLSRRETRRTVKQERLEQTAQVSDISPGIQVTKNDSGKRKEGEDKTPTGMFG
jgi:hypothetical protein